MSESRRKTSNGEEGNISKKRKHSFSDSNSPENMESSNESMCDSTDDKSIGVNTMPLLADFPGKYMFRYSLPEGNFRNSWEYSPLLNQVFIDMNKVLMVQFRFNKILKTQSQMYVRAMPVFCHADAIGLPVNRCTVHSIEDDPANRSHRDNTCRCLNYNLAGHVVRSQSVNAIYCYDPQTKRHSVCVPVGTGTQSPTDEPIEVLYTFACLTSCRKGKPRRHTNVVFTLESASGDIYGRTCLPVKICSCPKRDRASHEKDFLRRDKREMLNHKQTLIEHSYPLQPMLSHQSKGISYKRPVMDVEAFLAEEPISIYIQNENENDNSNTVIDNTMDNPPVKAEIAGEQEIEDSEDVKEDLKNQITQFVQLHNQAAIMLKSIQKTLEKL